MPIRIEELIAVDPRGEIGDRADAKQHVRFDASGARTYSIASVSARLETPAGLCDDAEMTIQTLSLAGTSLELIERGRGRPLLFLHAGEGLAPERPWLDLLSRKYRVIAPWHPGWGNSALIDGMGLVDALAYFYLDLAAELALEDAVLVGACFGGWVAAEMMVRSTARFSHLVLVDPLGIKVRGREERDI